MRNLGSQGWVSAPQRRRRGCLGCLVSMVWSLSLLGVATVLFLIAVNWVFNPWAFYLGGRYHVLPQWQGWARMSSSAAGGRYALYVRMTPTPTGPPYLSTSVRGDAVLCTPRGDRYYLKLGGGMAKHLPRDTVGQPIHLYMHTRVGMLGTGDGRPRLDLHGVWMEGVLSMQDCVPLAREFGPDGTMRPTLHGVAVNPKDSVSVLFTEVRRGCSGRLVRLREVERFVDANLFVSDVRRVQLGLNLSGLF